MIQSRADYLEYLEADRQSLNIQRQHPRFLGDEIWKFQRLLRKVEYYSNCRKSPFFRPYLWYLKYRFHSLSLKLGFTIPPNTCGPGLSIAHRGTIVINGGARIGKNCRLHVCVNIGAAAGTNQAPTIGDNVYIGPGAKLFGSIRIASNIAIGANAVVNKSFEQPGVSIAGVPAKVISQQGSEGLLFKGASLQM